MGPHSMDTWMGIFVLLFSVQGLNSTKNYIINIELNSGSSDVLPFFSETDCISSTFQWGDLFLEKKKGPSLE